MDTQLVAEVFHRLDTTGDGKLTLQEFTGLFKMLGGEAWSEDKISRLFAVADLDRDGLIDVDEFLSWVFRKKAGRAVVARSPEPRGSVRRKTFERKTSPDADTTDDEFDTESEISSNGSGEPSIDHLDGDLSLGIPDEAEESEDDVAACSTLQEPAGEDAKLDKKGKRRKAEDEAIIDETELFETLVYGGGNVRLLLGDFANLFARCKRAGLGPNLCKLVPQRIEALEGQVPEDLSPFEVGHLALLVAETPEATREDVRQRIDEVSEGCRMLVYDRNLERIGLESTSSIGFGQFKRLLWAVGASMLVDSDTLLTQLFWADANVFELTVAMANQVMRRLFLKIGRKQDPLLRQKVHSNDFMRMCHVQNLSDKAGKTGIPHAHLSLFFSNVLKNMPELLRAREAKRRAGKGKKKLHKHHSHKSISGRSKLSVLFEELFRAIPPGRFRSPLHMVLSLLENADALYASARKPKS